MFRIHDKMREQTPCCDIPQAAVERRTLGPSTARGLNSRDEDREPPREKKDAVPPVPPTKAVLRVPRPCATAPVHSNNPNTLIIIVIEKNSVSSFCAQLQSTSTSRRDRAIVVSGNQQRTCCRGCWLTVTG